MPVQINIGCGRTPTEGWRNYDNSWSVRLAKVPFLAALLYKARILSLHQYEFIAFAQHFNIRWADATKCIPEKSDSVDAIYCSHMLEHLDQDEVARFLSEARRVLKRNGVIRIAVPDINYHIRAYLKNQDADIFVHSTGLARDKPRTFLQALIFLLCGARNHHWMYDGESLCNRLIIAGFEAPRLMPPGVTTILEPGNLNLAERSPESVFVEAIKP